MKMKESISTSPTTTVGDDLESKVSAALDRYGHVREFQPLLELLLDIYEELKHAKDSGKQ